MSGVEFLPEAGGDEPPDDLAAPELFAPRPRRFGRAARLAVVVVAAAGLAGWVATRPSDPSPAAQPQAAAVSPTPTVHPTSTSASSVPSWSADHATLVRCSLGVGVRLSVARAMHRYLKGIAIDAAEAVRCVAGPAGHQKIVSESVVGQYGKVWVEVALSRRDAQFPMTFEFSSPHQHRPVPPVMLGGVETESAGIKIRISSTGDGRTMPPRFHIQQLADYLSLNTVL